MANMLFILITSCKVTFPVRRNYDLESLILILKKQRAKLGLHKVLLIKKPNFLLHILRIWIMQSRSVNYWITSLTKYMWNKMYLEHNFPWYQSPIHKTEFFTAHYNFYLGVFRRQQSDDFCDGSEHNVQWKMLHCQP